MAQSAPPERSTLEHISFTEMRDQSKQGVIEYTLSRCGENRPLAIPGGRTVFGASESVTTLNRISFTEMCDQSKGEQ